MVHCLCTISSKNPNPILIETVKNVKLFYPEFDIVVVDSDSSDFTQYSFLPNDVIVEYCKNKNWELGAWYYAFNKYNYYDIYMFIQDGLLPLSRIHGLDTDNYEKHTLYSFHFTEQLSAFGFYDDYVNIYKDSSIDFISEFHPDHRILGTAHSSFISDKDNVSKLLKLEEPYLEKNTVKTKLDSWLSERCIGIIADKHKNKRIDITQYFKKHNFNRDTFPTPDYNKSITQYNKSEKEI
jgi:hypothetical protein